MFVINDLSPQIIDEMQLTNTWCRDCPVALERLRLVSFLHYTFDMNQAPQQGELVVLDCVAESVLKIFTALYVQHFPIHQVRRIEHYHGSDQASMADNNTSCYNGRYISQTKTWSLHAYGLAIDVNPLQNPVISQDNISALPLIEPAEGRLYLDRNDQRPGMVDDIVSLFQDNGFCIWGGSWNSPIDYHHFQVAKAAAQLLAAMIPHHAQQFFNLYIKQPTLCHAIDSHDNFLLKAYKIRPHVFMEQLERNSDIMSMDTAQAYKTLSYF